MGTLNLRTNAGGSVIFEPQNTATDKTVLVPATSGTMATTDQIGIFKNLIINGDHSINQRGITNLTIVTGDSTTSYTSDRWYTYGNGVQTTATIQQVTLPNGTVVNSHRTTANAANSNSFLHPSQKIETFGKSYLRGKTITISTWVRTNLSNQRLRLCNTVSCLELGSVIPNDGNWHYVQATTTLPSNMEIGASHFMQAQPAFGSANVPVGGFIEFTLMQVEVGSVATPFEFRPYGVELALCQRYFNIIPRINVPAAGTSGNRLLLPPSGNYRTTPTASASAYALEDGAPAVTPNFLMNTAQGVAYTTNVDYGRTNTAYSVYVQLSAEL
jgi:hypothetical protein